MKQILSFLLFLLPALAFAQWPAAPNKIRLGNQTTGDGLIVRTDSIPDWTPADRNNAWLAFDTVANLLYFYEGGTWQEYASGGGGGVQYSDSLTTFVTPTQLSDSIVAIPTIYTADGTLTGNRTINGDNNFIFLLGGFFSTVDSLFYAQNSAPGFIPTGVNYTLTSFSSEIPAGITVNNFSDYATATAYYNNAPFSSLQSRVGADSSAVTVGNGNIFLTADTLDATNVTTFLGFPIGGGGVQYSDSLTVFVTPTMLADTAAAIRGDFPTDTNLANTDLVNGSVYRTYTIPNTHTLDFIDQGGGNNFLARFSNRGFLTADKPTLLLQIRDSVSTNFSNLLLTPDSVDLFANKLKLKMPPLDATPTRLLTIDPSTREVKYVLKDSIGGSGGPANLAYTGTADVIELDAGGTPVFIAEGSGVDVTQSGDTLTITGKGTRFVQDSITGATLTIDLNEAPTAIISLKMTSATSVTLTISNPYGFLTDATAPTYEGETGVYTFRFWGISGTDNVTWPANFYDMNGTALGTDALTAGTAYTCYYDPIANEYYCK